MANLLTKDSTQLPLPPVNISHDVRMAEWYSLLQGLFVKHQETIVDLQERVKKLENP